MKTFHLTLASLFLSVQAAFAATLTFGTSAPTPAGSAAISNWTGATFDAANVGGSNVNANGSPNNGTANDGTTYVATNRPAQGETFTTGSNAGGYTITAITVRLPGYTNNTASGSNIGSYSLSSTSSTFTVRVGRISGTTFIPYAIEYAASGGSGTPGTGGIANGPGTYLTFTLKAPIVLQPNTVYAFDLGTSGDYFETLGMGTTANGGVNPYAGGSAYTSGANGAAAGSITSQAGNRVFMVDMAPYTPPASGAFVHPGLLNTDADFERMRVNVAMGVEPWASGYSALTASWMGHNPTWNPNPQSTITRGSTNNTSLLYNDIAVAYGCALRWKVSGDTAYADEAVRILNGWGYKLTTLSGDTNIALIELYGYQYACVGEIMRTYPGWAPADRAQCQTMIYNVFYPLANSFLNGHFGTAYDHYWANWDLASMDTMYAIGVFCDNPAVANQALTYFYNGIGNGCIDRTVDFIHPGLLGQGQEAGRDQGHASLDIAELAPLCQMAWNQGVDLYGYENNRVLSVAEYTAKYNLFYDVPFTPYYNSVSGLMTKPADGDWGAISRPGWATLYNHYVNLKGLAAPYTQTVVNQDGAGYETGGYTFNGDEPEWDYLTSALPPIAAGANPSGLTAIVTAQQPVLSWWGSAYATSYNVLRSTTSGGPYTTIASGLTTNTYTDTSVVPGTTYYYVVNGTLASGSTGNSNEAQAILGTPLYAQLLFDETSGTNAADATGNGWNGTLVNGATWTAGKSGNAVNLAKASSQYVSIPAGVAANLSDFSISAWVYQTSVTTWARVFDFGSGDGFYGGVDVWGNTHWYAERYMYLTTQSGSGKVRFGISRSTGGGEEDVDGTSAVPTGQWTHVCVTKSGNVATLYVNGIAVGQNLNMPMMPLQLLPTATNYIGRSQSRNDPYFDGKIDDFRIYRGPLSTGAVYTLATGLQPATPPSAPTNLTVAALPGNQNSLSWTATSGATSYTVLRATSSGGPYTVVAALVSGTSYTDTGLTAGTTYYYEVDGANTGGDGAVSPASSGVVALPPLPSVPTGFTAISGSSTTAVLNWTAAANAYTYNIKRSLTSGGPYTTVASGVTATTYTDTGLTTGTTYYYVISSVNTAGESANSGEDGAMPSDLLVHLPFDETYGTTSADASGNGWNATLVNGPTWVPGIFGNAIHFAAAASQYATVAAGVVSTVNDFTISVWVNPTTLASRARVFDFGTGTNDMYLTIQGAAGAGRPRFGILTSSVAEQDIDSSVAIPTGAWTQIVITHTGTTGSMYINGTLVGTNTGMTLTGSNLGRTSQDFFGRSQWSSDPYLNGSIDDLRINSHAFTAAQIAAAAAPSPTVPTGLATIPGDGQISLSWAVDETATTYNVKRATVSGGPYTTVASGLTTPTFLDTGLTDGTIYYYVVSAVNWLGESANSAETAAVPYSIAWSAQDIGSVSPAGSTSVLGGTVTMNGSGADISGTADAFQFRSVPVTGDCIITARVWSVTNTNAWSKAGVMIRDSLASNAANAALVVTPTTTNGVSWQSRLTDGASTTNIGASGITAPYWVRLVRTGTTIQGYRSSDGVNWTSAGSATLSSLGSTAYVGLAVTSHSNGSLCTAVFDNVSVNWVPDQPSVVTATPGPEQVALSWNLVPNATSYNVYVANVSGGPYTPLATGLTSPSYVQTGFTSSATQYYVVSALNVAGEGFDSNEINAAPIFPPAAPAGPTATGGTGQVALSWTASSGATSYNIYRSTTSGGPYGTAIANTTSTSYVDPGAVSGTTYYYVITAVDAAGEGAITTEFSATPLPGTATGVTPVAGNGQVSLSWTAAPGAASYTIGRSTISGGPYITVASGNATTSFVDTGLTNGVAYYYVVTGVNVTGNGPASAEVSALPLPPIAAAPAGIAAVAGDGQVSLTWSGATYATSYNVKRATTSGGPYTTVANPANAGYVDTGLTNGTTYYYVVTTVDLAGESGNSAEVNAKPLPPIAAAPTGVAAVAGNGQVSLSWNAATYATSYNVKRATTSGGPYTTVASPTGTSAVDTSLTNGTTYYYVVTTVDLAGESGNSSEVSAKPLPPIAAAPTGVAAVAGNGQVSLSWNAATYATGYNVKRATTSGGPYTTVASPTGTSAVDTSLTNGTTYYYVVTTVDLAGESGNSAEVNAEPLPPIPAAPTGLAATGKVDEVDLTWTASANAATYNVKRSTTDGGPYTTVASGVTLTGYNDTGLADNTTYYYVVSAVNLAGESPNSAQAGATSASALPAMVTGLTAVANSDQVTLSWTAVTNVASYTVSRATVSGGPYAAVAGGITGTSYTDPGLVNGTTYYYVVAAVNTAGAGPNSTEVSATPLAQNLFWDTTTAAGLANGNGAWDTGVTPTWSNSSTGTSSPLLTWLNDDNTFLQTGGTFTATVPGGTTIRLGSLNQTGTSTAATITGGTLQIDANAGITNAIGGGNKPLTINSAVVLNSPGVIVDNETTAGAIVLNGVISETGGSRALTKLGAGVLQLGTAANTFSGGVTIASAGKVAFNNSASFGTGTITFAGGTSLTSTAQIYTTSAGPGTLANNLLVTAGAFGAYTGDRTMTFSGSLLNTGTANGTFLIAPGTHAASVTMSGDNHAFNGTISFTDNNAATLLLNSVTSGSGNAMWKFTGSGTKGLGLNVAGASAFPFGELSSASGAGRLYNNQATGTSTLQVGDATANSPSFGGVILDGTAGGKIALSKVGSDTQIFTGTNTFTGPTTVSSGTLLINGSLAAGSTVTVAPGATLGGSGTINGSANVSAGGSLTPGGSAATGTLTFAGALNLNAGSLLNFDLGKVAASDKIALTGSYVAPAGGTATINLNARSGFTTGTYTLVTGAGGIGAGSFALGTIPSGYTYTYQLSAASGILSLVVSNPPPAPTGLSATPSSGIVSLSWTASAGATSYTVLRSATSGSGYAQVASGITATSYVDTGLANGTTDYYVVAAVNVGGTSANSNQVSATPATAAIVDSWLDNDIGSVGQPGSSSYSADTFTLNGSGAGVTGSADGFDYTYQLLVGDGTIIARVASRTTGEAGVMIRETLTANSRCVDMMLQGSLGAVFQSRATVGGSLANNGISGSITVPYWVKLSRLGTVFRGYVSPDGVTWTQVGAVTNTMATSVYVGLAQSSMTFSSLATATFTNVSIVPTSAWSSQDIGAVPLVGASYYSNAVATINGSGADIGGAADQFRFTYMIASGNCDITARVTAVGNSDPAAKAGVMIRETLTAGSRHASVFVTPGSGLIFQWRSATSGAAASASTAAISAPYWVRVVRKTNTFTAYSSPDGTTWTSLGSQSITMATTVYIGLPVSSHTTNLSTATLDNITAP